MSLFRTQYCYQRLNGTHLKPHGISSVTHWYRDWLRYVWNQEFRWRYKGKQRSTIINSKYYFREAITWSDVTSGIFSLRYRSIGSIHDVKGMSAFTNDENKLYLILAILNTKIGDYIFKMLNPSLSLQIGNFQSFPVLFRSNDINKAIHISKDSISHAMLDWERREEDWNYRRCNLI